MNRLLWFVLVLAIAMGPFFAGTKLATRETLFAASADGTHAAWAENRRCWSGPCQALWRTHRGHQGVEGDVEHITPTPR